MILAFTVVAVAMLTPQVLAIGPENALGKNPKVGIMNDASYYMINPNGIVLEWVPEVPINPELSAILMTKDAGDFQINNAFEVTNPVQVLQMENRWLYLSQGMLYNFFTSVGMPSNIATGIAASHPDGVYMKRNVI